MKGKHKSVVGITWNKATNKWRVRSTAKGKSKALGCFKYHTEAVFALERYTGMKAELKTLEQPDPNFIFTRNGDAIKINPKWHEMLSLVPWNVSHFGYAISNGERMHRIILGAKVGEFVDHANGNRLDNMESMSSLSLL